MKVSIDKEKCSIPEVFEMKDDGTVDVKDEYKGKDVPKELEPKVKEAQSICPSSAIMIEE